MNEPKIGRAFSHLSLSCFKADKEAFSSSTKTFMKIEAGSSIEEIGRTIIKTASAVLLLFSTVGSIFKSTFQIDCHMFVKMCE